VEHPVTIKQHCPGSAQKHFVLDCAGTNGNVQDLFASFQRGEERGYAHFFHTHYKALFFYANGLLKDEEAAEDTVADCFLKLYEKRTTIQAAATVKSFLYTTVRNACLDKLRQQKVRSMHHAGLAYLQEKTEASAAEHLLRTETLSLILAAIESLPPASRAVFKLYYLEGKSYEEIAQELGRSKETVRKQKHYGLTVLRGKLTGPFTILLCFFFS